MNKLSTMDKRRLAGSPLSSGGCNMRRLLDDLHKRKKIIEQDQREYEKARRQIETADEQISQLELDLKTAQAKGNELVEIAASKKTLLNFVEIRSRVVNANLKRSEKELRTSLEELHQTRMKSSEISSSMLTDAVKCAVLFNRTNLGQKNRQIQLEFEKQQLESELAEFLEMQKKISECLEQSEDIETKAKQCDENDKKVMQHIKSLNNALEDLEVQEYDFVNLIDEKCEKLYQQIQEKERSVALLQTKADNAKETVKSQMNCTQPKMARPQRSRYESAIQGTCDRQSGTDLGIEPENGQTTSGNVYSGKASKFHLPLKSQRRTSFHATSNSNELEDLDDLGKNYENDENLCYAAAAKVSQEMKPCKRVTTVPSSCEGFDMVGPSPSKVRHLERQPLITTFMSSTKVTMKPMPSSVSLTSPSETKTSATATTSEFPFGVKGNSRKKFQFKKKSVPSKISDIKLYSDSEKENLTTGNYDRSSLSFFEDTSSSAQAFPNRFSFSSTNKNEEGRKQFFSDRPFSTFHSSSILLEASQDKNPTFSDNF